MSAEDEDEDKDNESVDSESVEAEAAASAATREEPAETRSVEARRKLRDQMDAEIRAFLERGGRIEQVEPSMSARPASYTATAGSDAV